MPKKMKLIECPRCKKLVKNAFENPYDAAKNISVFHVKRSEKEYDFECPECGTVCIFLSEPMIYEGTEEIR